MCPEYKFGVVITLREQVNDPVGVTVMKGLHKLGFPNVESLRVGRTFDGQLTAPTIHIAREIVNQMARSQANPVTENFRTKVSYYRPSKS